MTRIHFEIEVLYATTFTTACGARNTDKNATIDEAQVSCPKCLAALGYELPSKVVPYSRMSIETDERGGRLAA